MKGDLDNRLDPLFYSEDIFKFLKITPFAVKKIREICTFAKSGFGAGKQDQNLEGKGFIQIRPTNMDENGLLKFDRNVYIPENYLEKNNAYVLLKEDILFNNTNSQEWVGKTAYFEEEGTFLHSNHVTVLQVDKNNVQPKYLWILFNLYQRKRIFYNICTNWNNQSGVGIERLLSLKIPVPQLEIQQTIINIFERAYSEKITKEIQAKALLESIGSYLLEELGITLPDKQENTLKNRVFLRNISEVSGGRFDPNFYSAEFYELVNSIKNVVSVSLKKVVGFSGESWNQQDYFDDLFPYIEISEINISYGKVENVVFLNKQEAPSRAKMIVRENDIVVSTTRPSRGAIAKISSLENMSIASTGFAVMRYFYDINRDYIHSILRHQICLNQMVQRSSGGNYPAITQEELSNLQIPLPPLKIQEKIVAEIIIRQQQATRLQTEAKEILEQAKAEVERMILGE